MKWYENNSIIALYGSAIAIALACLMKITSLYLGILLVYLFYNKYSWKFIIKPIPWLYALFIISSVTLWYHHAHQNYLNGGVTSGIWEYGKDKWGNWDMLFQFTFWNRIIFQSIAERHLTWCGFVLFVIGFFTPKISTKESTIYVWMLSVIFYFIIVAKGNYIHEYYQLPFIPQATIIIGKTCYYYLNKKIPRWKSILVCTLLFGTIILSLWRLSDYLSRENPDRSLDFQLAQSIRSYCLSDDTVCLLGHDPTLLYLIHRKGYLISSTKALEKIIAETNCRVFAGFFSSIDKSETQIIRERIFKLKPAIINKKFFIVILKKQKY